ncbi:NUDIX domain-containing protein [Arthrobacter sp. zg-Y1171]|uniref:NUDIX domain-containing protein n=1 Tax=Arthrobacter sp. zg-Y1171 TaxID=2964610 RepID=UPI002105C68D|nr:NUDIX hydrolase [Arthrobacter sp. zg-Y1171]MCQ1995166.1 NUDIX hydrolase [Arthrobacter sp. zg-Y1171]UWX80790.1 NUDIX hydrolase [Arthrobacter sp. zg-Y1171]
MAAQGLSGFYGSVFRRSITVRVLIRTSDGRVLMLRNGNAWELPGGVVKGGEDPRSAARRIARATLDPEFNVGRVLVLDYVQGTQGQADSIDFLFDGGTLSTSVTSFTGAGGEWEAGFIPLADCGSGLDEGHGGEWGAALEALELGTMVELVNGEPVSAGPVAAPALRRMMPPLEGFSGILGH